MNKRKLNKIYAQVAKEYGVSTEEVQREIKIALKLAQRSPDPKVQANWAAIPCKGDALTTAEVIAHLAKKVRHNADA